MLDYLLYIIVRFISLSLIILPVTVSLFVGRRLGALFYYLNPKKRSIVYKNLRIAFSNVYSPEELKKIARGFYENFGQNIVETLIIPKINKNYIKRYVPVENLGYIDDCIRNGKGAILLSFHLGGWEISHITCSLLGYPFTILVKPQQRFKKLSGLLDCYRRDKGCRVIETGMMAREVIKNLRQNQLIGMVADQSGRDGMQVPFLNRAASLPTGAARFALKLGTPIILAFSFREKGAHNRIILEEPLYLKAAESQDGDIYNALVKIKTIAEKHIRQHPEQYFWFYKVWKYSQERSVIILTDEKKGHLRQAEAVIKSIRESTYNVKINIVNICFKNRLTKILLNICALFTKTKYTRGDFRYLRWFLKKHCYKKLSSLYADIFISCGSSLAAVNLFTSGENNARSVVIMKPALLPLKRFDLAIIPKHDNPVLKSNVIITKGALNLIDEEYLSRFSQILRSKINLQGKKLKIGVLIGGNNNGFSLKKQAMVEFIKQIKSAAEYLDAELLITTSRRTSKDIGELIKSEFKDYNLCKLIVIANEENIPEAVGGILGVSQLIVVSPDSISMVSEAASSGKNVVVFDIDTQDAKLPKKHRRFLTGLSEEGYINFIAYNKITDILVNAAYKKVDVKKLNDREIIKEAILRLF